MYSLTPQAKYCLAQQEGGKQVVAHIFQLRRKFMSSSHCQELSPQGDMPPDWLPESNQLEAH